MPTVRDRMPGVWRSGPAVRHRTGDPVGARLTFPAREGAPSPGRAPARPRRTTIDLLSIGDFAALSRLSPKALRRYDELGLLRPARVDAHNGHRWYDPAQVEYARRVALLRRLDVPLARIPEPARDAPALRALRAR
jgi:hypothetical protein